MTAGEVRPRTVTAAGQRWSLLLPPGWVGLPTDADGARRAVKALLDVRLRTLPRDQVAPTRRALERQLRAVLSDARGVGATAVFMQTQLVHGLPVEAGLTVTSLEMGDDGKLLQALGSLTGSTGVVVESATRSCAGLPALRRRRRFVREQEGSAPVDCTGVDWVVALPDTGEVLVLAFATSTAPVTEELVQLFDAVAQTLDLEPLDAAAG